MNIPVKPYVQKSICASTHFIKNTSPTIDDEQKKVNTATSIVSHIKHKTINFSEATQTLRREASKIDDDLKSNFAYSLKYSLINKPTVIRDLSRKHFSDNEKLLLMLSINIAISQLNLPPEQLIKTLTAQTQLHKVPHIRSSEEKSDSDISSLSHSYSNSNDDI